MSQRILNLTLPVVSAKIDQVLRDNALEPTLDLLATSDLRDRLTTYVVRRLPAVYVTLESEEVGALKDSAHVANYSYYPDQQLAEIEQLIQEGLRALMEIECPYPTATLEAVEGMSCWFG